MKKILCLCLKVSLAIIVLSRNQLFDFKKPSAFGAHSLIMIFRFVPIRWTRETEMPSNTWCINVRVETSGFAICSASMSERRGFCSGCWEEKSTVCTDRQLTRDACPRMELLPYIHIPTLRAGLKAYTTPLLFKNAEYFLSTLRI